MGRPRKDTITVRPAPSPTRKQQWGAFMRYTDIDGERRTAAKFFDTEAEGLAYKAKTEGLAAAPDAPPLAVIVEPSPSRRTPPATTATTRTTGALSPEDDGTVAWFAQYWQT